MHDMWSVCTSPNWSGSEDWGWEGKLVALEFSPIQPCCRGAAWPMLYPALSWTGSGRRYPRIKWNICSFTQCQAPACPMGLFKFASWMLVQVQEALCWSLRPRVRARIWQRPHPLSLPHSKPELSPPHPVSKHPLPASVPPFHCTCSYSTGGMV